MLFIEFHSTIYEARKIVDGNSIKVSAHAFFPFWYMRVCVFVCVLWMYNEKKGKGDVKVYVSIQFTL